MDYRIVVRGRLSGRMAARFDQLCVAPSGDVTELSGEIVDQAQLHGILDRIRELGLELLALQADPSPAQPPGGAVRWAAGHGGRRMVMRVGPVEYAVFAFPGDRFKGDIADAIVELVDRGTVRVLDLAFVRKDADGSIEGFELSGLSEDEAGPFQALVGDEAGLLSEEDIASVGAGLPAGSSAGLIVWENTWAARFSQAVREADGVLVAHERIPAAAVEAALDHRAGLAG